MTTTAGTGRGRATKDGDEPDIIVRQTCPADFDAIIAMGGRVFPRAVPWTVEQLEKHLELFPQGQLVAVDRDVGVVVGMSASLIVTWDDYEVEQSWHDFTDDGWFTNHDPLGRTLYGAETMVHPDHRRRGVGTLLYDARRELVRTWRLARIRFGALLSGYEAHADGLSPEDYVEKVVAGEMRDPTISFQIRHGFRPIAVVTDYLPAGREPRSRGNAVVMEWLNPDAPEGAGRP